MKSDFNRAALKLSAALYRLSETKINPEAARDIVAELMPLLLVANHHSRTEYGEPFTEENPVRYLERKLKQWRIRRTGAELSQGGDFDKRK